MGKRMAEATKRVDASRQYDLSDAVQLVRETGGVKFDATVEVAVRLGVDPKHADQMVRGAVVLPHGTGRTRRVAVFAKGDKAQEATEAGAEVVGAEDLVAAVEGGQTDFDVAVATPDMMPMVGKLGRLLGPRGLMPNPKTGTVTFDVAAAVREIKAGKIEYRVEKAGIVHAPIGRLSFAPEAIEENLRTLMDALIRAKPSGAKGTYVKSVTLSSTMGPGVPVNPMVGSTQRA